MARRHGSKGQVMMNPTGGATAVAVGDLNEWTLNLARDKEDVTCFGDTNKQYVLGLPDIRGRSTASRMTSPRRSFCASRSAMSRSS